jgi:hypothetical protein
MWIFGLYRFYVSICVGILCWLVPGRSFWLSIAAAIVARAAWFAIERIVERMSINRDFRNHEYRFKQQLGPYGIRIANQAEQDFRTKKSLAEVFVAAPARLKKNVEQLQMMDTLFNAGMRPDGDAYLLHDCKLKYGLYRMEQAEQHKKTSSAPLLGQ